MGRYRVKPGYCLHLPNRCFVHPGEEVELSGELERDVLAYQGWKVEPVLSDRPAAEEQEPTQEPVEIKAMDKPPKDRAVKGAKNR